MVIPWGKFCILFMPNDESNSQCVVLEKQLDNQSSEEITTLTKMKVQDELKDINIESISFFCATPAVE